MKGGTAINLIAFKNLARLSVDLDLDFARLLSKEETLDAREVKVDVPDLSDLSDTICQSDGSATWQERMLIRRKRGWETT